MVSQHESTCDPKFIEQNNREQPFQQCQLNTWYILKLHANSKYISTEILFRGVSRFRLARL